MRKYLYAVLGMIIMMLVGAIYAWSVICIPIKTEFPNWSSASLALCFTICTMCFCLGGFFNAWALGKKPLFLGIGICIILYCSGLALSALTSNIVSLYIGFGVMIGFATGMMYNIIMGCIVPWFKQKTGFISGVLLMSLGIGSFIIGKVYQLLINTGKVSWQSIFLGYGIIIFVFFFIGAISLRRSPIIENNNKNTFNYSNSYSSKDMIKSKIFWVLFFWGIINAGAGYMLIAHANGILFEVNPSIDTSSAATVVGLLGIFNGVGRAGYGFLYDIFGYRKCMLLIEVLLIICTLTLFLGLKMESVFWIVIGFGCGGLFFAGVAANTPPLISEFFGEKYFALNYAIINLCVLLASFGSTIAGALYDSRGTYLSVVVLMAFVCIFSVMG